MATWTRAIRSSSSTEPLGSDSPVVNSRSLVPSTTARAPRTPAAGASASRADSLPNVEFRRRVAPGPALRGDARLLLVPYPVDSRPRVILEAQANGVLVIVGDVPALGEAMGGGCGSVPLESVDDWVATVGALWADEVHYATLAAAAAEPARRAEVNPRTVAQEFEDVLRRALEGSNGRRGRYTWSA